MRKILMMNMKKMISQEKTLSIAWNWTMEALADSKQVDSELLDDLLCKIPNGYDSLSSYSKERFALKHLEDLLATTTNANMTNSNLSSDYDIIDVEEPAQDVYDRLLDKMGTPGSIALIPEVYKFNIRQFILQKRASLPKCALQQLVVLMEGGHPSTELLREARRLNREHQEEPRIKLDRISGGVKTQAQKLIPTHLVTENLDKVLQDPHAKSSISTRKKEKMVKSVDEGATAVSVDSATNSSMWSKVDEIISPLVRENGTKIMEDDPSDDGMLSYKRKESELAKELQAGCSDNVEVNLMEHNSDHLHVCEPLESLHGSILSSSIQNKTTDLAKETHDQYLQGKRIRVEDVGDYEHVVSKRIKESVSDGQIHYEPGLYDSNSILQEAPADGFPAKSYVSEHENQAKPETSHDSGEIPVKARSIYSEEDMAIAQMTLNQDSPETEWTEENSCIKCNRGDQLLICCVSTCVIAIHESCLGSSASCDVGGNFYCPFCSYSQAVTKYCEMKKKLVQAKKKAKLAKNHLDKFMNLEHGNQQKQPSELPFMEELNQPRMVEKGNCLDEIDGNRNQKEIPNNQAIQAEMCQQEAKVAHACTSTLHQGPCPSQIIDRDIGSISKETQQKGVKCHVGRRIVENREYPELSSPKCSDNLNQREKMISKKTSDFTDWQQEHVNAAGELSGTKTVLCGQEHADVRTENAYQQHQPVTRKRPSPILDVHATSPDLGTETVLTNQEHCSVGNTSADLPQQQDKKGPCPSLDVSARACTDTVLLDKKHADVGAVNANEQQQFLNSSQKPSHPLDENIEEVSEHDNGDRSYEFRRRPNTGRRDSNHNLSSRRKITPWTFEEEEKLKEGVHKYVTSDANKVPWKEILVFGRNVFQDSRTCIDLKDKWRNICKGGGSRAR